MNPCPARSRFIQRGAATLLIALVLMIALTVITLSVAKTRVNEAQVNINQQWQAQLFASAESTLEETLPRLSTLTGWTVDPVSGEAHYRATRRGNDPQIESVLTLRRSPPPQRFVDMQARAQRNDKSGFTVQISQRIRQLTILSPLAELAPPLILAGCPSSFPRTMHIYPRYADSDRAGNAVWLTEKAPCPGLGRADLHGGAVTRREVSGALRDAMFTLDREAYAALAERDRALPPGQRQYWLVQAPDLDRGHWSRSVGTLNRPVLLYFPADTGCPVFADGVQVYGVVFIESPCKAPLAENRLEINGTLIIDGPAPLAGNIRLANLQTLDPAHPWFTFPVLHNIRVPGSWRDF